MKASRDVQHYLDLCADQGFRLIETKHGHRIFPKDMTKQIVQVPYRFGGGADEANTRARLRSIGVDLREDLKPARVSPEPIPVPIEKARPLISLHDGKIRADQIKDGSSATSGPKIEAPVDPLARIGTLIARVNKVADDLISAGTSLKQLVSDLETEALNVDAGNEKLRNLAKALEALRP